MASAQQRACPWYPVFDRMDVFHPARLRKLKHVAFVVSTHGEGEPPEGALELFEYLGQESAARLSGLNYRILALGDRSYPLFCAAGRKLEKLLQHLDAKPFGERLECDVDYQDSADKWCGEIVEFTEQNLVADQAETPFTHLSIVPSEPRWNRQHPYLAEVARVQKITGQDSASDVHHLELSLQGSGLQYQPGDALGVWAPNDPVLVDEITEQLGVDPSDRVEIGSRQLTLAEALATRLEITRLSGDTIRAYANAGDQGKLKSFFSALEPGQQHTFMKQRQLADLLAEYPAQMDAQTLVELLRPLSPRSYSIASSQCLVYDEVHLTVATRHSNAVGVPRQGAASSHLNHRLSVGENVRVFLEQNHHFRLPKARKSPIIMIAAGTGIAPFRAFMQELETREAAADCWLIFGNPHLRTDFLYQRDWLHWRKTGLLRRIDTAWSRDQPEKRYVQHLVREQAERLELWLSRGACIYLCGSLQMGTAVLDALQHNLSELRQVDAARASAIIKGLRRERRLQKDLY